MKIKSSMRWFNKVCLCSLVTLMVNGCSAKIEEARDDTNPLHALSNVGSIGPAHVAKQESKKIPVAVAAPPPFQKKERPIVKGIYVSAWSSVGSKFEQLIDLVDRTDLNTMVIDVKNDSGQVTYPSAVPLVNEIGANSHVIIQDMKAKLQRLKGKHIYTIARLVVFKDPYLSKKKPAYAMKSRNGGIWKDAKGIVWVDPFKKDVWDYNIEIAKEVASLGFDEVQFDYVRFPENGKKVDQEVQFDNPQKMTKAQDIAAFLQKAREGIGGRADISADVFGLTTSLPDDMGIGQDWGMISKQVNYISPMLYPSHYTTGIYGVKYPDLQPYAIIHKAIQDANGKNRQLQLSGQAIAQIRPWYQDFTATWVKPHKKYGVIDVKEQIKAARELGVEQFLLWNPSSTYSYR
ncbi:putative glycoside hydrolase [Paenibacillus roseipurpureus]|uniref:Glycoside hydrolase n=1 Tax=Paenibacillus roseopurpureus TaxID=2918901 RepID=A0AA96RKQ4_9BACL|nr:putative glycoside hydrolase [Paenibacillus sp. MBLB1832]WNR44599.1 putative glycoside hydrolase [Paenibacillus sp. MBLB1832]